MLVGSRMTPDPFTVTPRATIAEALRITRSQRIRHIPVVDGDRLAGLVTERDLRLAAPAVYEAIGEELRQAINTKTVDQVMITQVITATPEMPIEDATKLLYENRIGCLPVMHDERLVGIITESDLLRALVELFGAHHPFARIEIRMANRAGELARVVRVIGIEHKVNISGLIVPPSGTGDYSVAIVQLNSTDPVPIVHALRKLGYVVGWPAIELDPESGADARDSMADTPVRRHIPVEL